METCILQLDDRLFRLVYFRVRTTGDVESVELDHESVELGDSIEGTGAIGRRAWIQGLAVASKLVAAAREQVPRAHILAIVSETVGSAENAEGFFEALRRSTGVTAETRLPSEILQLIAGRPSVDEGVSSTRSRDPFRAQGPTRSRTRSSLPSPS
jgi:hypothetical protein